jgi:hypothetical protein
MSIRTILAAALVAGSFAVPALASDGHYSNGVSNGPIDFMKQGQTASQTPVLIEGRNSARTVEQQNRITSRATPVVNPAAGFTSGN